MTDLTAISLFTGVGGLDLGFEAAGFRTAAAVEMDPAACRALRAARPEWPVLEGDIHRTPTDAILAAAGLAPGEADILIGGPPCQPFSKSGYWARGDALRLDDPRAGTLGEYLRVLREARPRAFLLENVPGLGFRGKDEGLRLILDGIRQLNEAAGTNYRVAWRKLNAVDYGVPQMRERLILIAARDGREFRFPEPTHADPAAMEPGDAREPWRTAWDALGDLPAQPNERGLEMGGKWAALLPSIPEGQNYLWHTSRGGGMSLFGWRRRYWSFLLKLAKDRPSWTIQAQPGSAIGPFHWKSRKLSTLELCRLQTLPRDVALACGRTDAQRLLGNAVPSLLAEVLGRAIREQLLDAPLRTPLQLMPPRRTKVPAPEPIAGVPSRYLGMIGDHADHPGTGLGWGSTARGQERALVAGE
ncbi:MAG: DNA cytosine methyltransferase [Amaricoccus sp.]|uniref:DNA cytosine methyltransferase n=1 Tax=Amaricoccus sp. TaxID=1872485 RepID=UPI0039E3A7AA